MRTVPTLLLTISLILPACGPGDPKAPVHRDRARWTLELLSWAQTEDGGLSLSARVSGPTHSGLEQLSYRITLFDAARAELGQEWRTIDLAEVPRGGPKELTLRVEPPGAVVDGVALSLVLAPTPEEERHIVELQL